MAFKKRFWRKKRTGGISKKKSVRKTGKNKLVTKSQLYRAIRRNVETKVASTTYGWTLFNSTISATADRVAFLPSIGQGTAQNQRVGNAIKPLKLVLRGYVAYNTNASSAFSDARLLGGRLFVYQDKIVRNYNNAIDNFQLLNIGGTSGTYDGTVLNYLSPHNNEMFQWFADKRMKFLKPFGQTSNGAPSATNAITGMDNSLFHPFTITLTGKHLPSVLKYDQTESTNNPVNFAPYLSLGYCDLLNNSADVLLTQLGMSFVATLYYEDA